MHHLGRADAVDNGDAGAVLPRSPDGFRQMLAGGEAGAQCLQRILQRGLREHRLIGRRRGGEVGDSEPGDGFEHRRRAWLLDGRGGGAEAEREQQCRAEAEGEGDRGAGHGDIAGTHAKMRLRERVARREDIAVEMDAALGHTGGAAGEGDQRRIVLGGVDCRQRVERHGANLQLAPAIIAVIFDCGFDEMGLVGGLAEVTDEAAVDDGVADLRALDHGRDLTWTQ